MTALELPRDKEGNAVQATAQGASQHLTLGNSSQRTASALNSASKVVRLAPDVDCYYRFGNSSVTADRSGGASFLAAGGVEYRRIKPDEGYLAVIKKSASTDDGIMNIEEPT